MRVHLFTSTVVFLVLAALGSCDTGEPDAPSLDALVGNYTLVQYGGAPLPSDGVTQGRLVLRIEATLPVYHLEWVYGGTAIQSDGLYSVAANTISFFGSLGTETFDHSGVIEGEQIMLSINDGVYTTFTFERD